MNGTNNLLGVARRFWGRKAIEQSGEQLTVEQKRAVLTNYLAALKEGHPLRGVASSVPLISKLAYGVQGDEDSFDNPFMADACEVKDVRATLAGVGNRRVERQREQQRAELTRLFRDADQSLPLPRDEGDTG